MIRHEEVKNLKSASRFAVWNSAISGATQVLLDSGTLKFVIGNFSSCGTHNHHADATV